MIVIDAAPIVMLLGAATCYSKPPPPTTGGTIMISRRLVLGTIASFAVLSFGATAFALDRKFDQKAFDAAQAAGRPILVEVSAPWCPTCKAQAPILSRLKSDARFKNLAAFVIDFDSQKDLLKKFNVQRQSTLIVFKGKRETGRSTGDTNPQSIEQLLAKSI
jgi:thiol-disulfide isomerase/thioredoxin